MDDQYIIASYINSSNLIISIDIHPNVHIYIYIYILSLLSSFREFFPHYLHFNRIKYTINNRIKILYTQILNISRYNYIRQFYCPITGQYPSPFGYPPLSCLGHRIVARIVREYKSDSRRNL